MMRWTTREDQLHIGKFFDTVDQEWLIRFLEHRIIATAYPTALFRFDPAPIQQGGLTSARCPLNQEGWATPAANVKVVASRTQGATCGG